MMLKRIPFRPMYRWFTSSGQMIHHLHNQTNQQQNKTMTESSTRTTTTTSMPDPIARWQSFNELDNQLQQVKVFAEERIIQVINEFCHSRRQANLFCYFINPFLIH